MGLYGDQAIHLNVLGGDPAGSRKIRASLSYHNFTPLIPSCRKDTFTFLPQPNWESANLFRRLFKAYSILTETILRHRDSGTLASQSAEAKSPKKFSEVPE
jgi:hypothetical protein